jgi:hypothetical protein
MGSNQSKLIRRSLRLLLRKRDKLYLKQESKGLLLIRNHTVLTQDSMSVACSVTIDLYLRLFKRMM